MLLCGDPGTAKSQFLKYALTSVGSQKIKVEEMEIFLCHVRVE